MQPGERRPGEEGGGVAGGGDRGGVDAGGAVRPGERINVEPNITVLLNEIWLKMCQVT